MTHSLFDDCIDSRVKSCDKPHAKSRNKSTLIKSPLRYPGGKSRAVAFLAQFLPKDIDEFREPFFGGVLLAFISRKIRATQKPKSMLTI